MFDEKTGGPMTVFYTPSRYSYPKTTGLGFEEADDDEISEYSLELDPSNMGILPSYTTERK